MFRNIFQWTNQNSQNIFDQDHDMIFRNRTYGPAGGETLEQKKARWALWTERIRRWNGIDRIGPFFYGWLGKRIMMMMMMMMNSLLWFSIWNSLLGEIFWTTSEDLEISYNIMEYLGIFAERRQSEELQRREKEQRGRGVVRSVATRYVLSSMGVCFLYCASFAVLSFNLITIIYRLLARTRKCLQKTSTITG